MAILAQGTIFTFNGVLVGGIDTWSGFSGEADDIPVTNLDSVAMEFVQGLQDFGPFTLELQRDPNDLGQIAMDTAKAAQATETCVLTLPDVVALNVATFQAYVKSQSMDGGTNAVTTGTANLRITGDVVWTDGTP